MKEIPALYDVARQITHGMGLPWTDPRSGETHQPPNARPPVATKKPKKPKKPKRTRKSRRA